jgi:hypothetical protein
MRTPWPETGRESREIAYFFRMNQEVGVALRRPSTLQL